MAALSRKRKKAPDDPGDPPYEEQMHCRAELDTHADTCAFGDCSHILLDTGKRVIVGDFQDRKATSNVAIVTQAICVDDERTMETTMQIYHQSLHVPGMRRLSGLQVRGQESEVDFSVPLESSDLGPSQLDPGGNRVMKRLMKLLKFGDFFSSVQHHPLLISHSSAGSL